MAVAAAWVVISQYIGSSHDPECTCRFAQLDDEFTT